MKTIITEIHEDTDLLTVKEVCLILRISRITLYKLTKRGAIPAFKIGRALRYRRGDVNSALKAWTPIEFENFS